MKIEAVIKSAATLPLHKKALLNIMYTQNILSENFGDNCRIFPGVLFII